MSAPCRARRDPSFSRTPPDPGIKRPARSVWTSPSCDVRSIEVSRPPSTSHDFERVTGFPRPHQCLFGTSGVGRANGPTRAGTFVHVRRGRRRCTTDLYGRQHGVHRSGGYGAAVYQSRLRWRAYSARHWTSSWYATSACPSNPNSAMGAIGEDVRVINPDVVRACHINTHELREIEAAERAELERRADRFRDGHPRESLAGRTALVVDDGITTGAASGRRRVVHRLPSGAPRGHLAAAPCANASRPR